MEKFNYSHLLRRKVKALPTLIPFASKNFSRSCKRKEESELLLLSPPAQEAGGWGTHWVPSAIPTPDREEGVSNINMHHKCYFIYLHFHSFAWWTGFSLQMNKNNSTIKSLLMSSKKRSSEEGQDSVPGPFSATSPLRDPRQIPVGSESRFESHPAWLAPSLLHWTQLLAAFHRAGLDQSQM